MTHLPEQLKKTLGMNNINPVELQDIKETTPDSVQNDFIYEMTNKQFNLLKEAIERDNNVFAIIDSIDSDPDSKKLEVLEEKRQLDDLINLELIVDVSDRFSEQIQVVKLNNKERGFRVYCLTPYALLMFNKSKNEKIN